MSLGGGTRRGNNYTLDGVPITDMRNRASAHPSIESLEDVKVQVHTYDAEMGRTGGGVFNTTLKSGTNTFRGNGVLPGAPDLGPDEQLLQRDRRARQSRTARTVSAGGAVGGPIVRNRTFFWFTTEGYDDTQTRNVSTLFPTAAMRTRRLLAADQRRRAAGDDLRPADRAAVPGQPDSGRPHQPGRGEHAAVPAAARHRLDNGSDNYTRTSLIKSKYAQLYSVKLEHKITDSVSLSGFYLYNKTQEPEANYFGSADQTEPNRFADPNDYYLGAQAADSGAEQHLGPEQQLGAGAAVRDDVVSGRQHAEHRLRSAHPRLLADATRTRFSSTSSRRCASAATTDRAGRWARSTRPRSTGSRRAPTPAISKLVGSHTFKFGGDWRKIGVDFFTPERRRRLFRLRQGHDLVERRHRQHHRRQSRSPRSCSATLRR